MTRPRRNIAFVVLLFAAQVLTPISGTRPELLNVVIEIPSAATWNCGGGAPKPEFLGGGWESVSDGFWSEAEKRVGALILNLSGFPDDKVSFDFTRYNSLKASATLPSNVNTVEQLLAGLPEAAQKAGYNIARFGCYKNVSVEDIFKFAMGTEKKMPAMSLDDGTDCWGLEGFQGKSLFGGPDGCLKDRAKFGRSSFIELLGKPAAEYWDGWLQAFPPTFSEGLCHLANEDTASQLKKMPDIHAADIFPLAIFDRLVFLVTDNYQNTSGAGTPVEPQRLSESSVGDAIQSISGWAAKQVDVLLLQEATQAGDPVSGYTKYSSGQKGGEDTAIWIKAALNNKNASALAVKHLGILRTYFEKGEFGKFEGELPTFASKRAFYGGELKAVASNAAQMRLQRFNFDSYTKAVTKFWSARDANKVTVAVAGTTLLVTAHADSAGYTCGEVLVMARMLQAMMDSKRYGVLVGMDANTQPVAKVGTFNKDGTFNEHELLKWSDNLGFKYPSERNTNHTVDKQRGFVQTQVLKAGKVDRVFKDWLLYRGPTIPGATYEQMPYQVVNNPTDPANFLKNSFPTDAFPVDHFLVFLKKGAVEAKS